MENALHTKLQNPLDLGLKLIDLGLPQLTPHPWFIPGLHSQDVLWGSGFRLRRWEFEPSSIIYVTLGQLFTLLWSFPYRYVIQASEPICTGLSSSVEIIYSVSHASLVWVMYKIMEMIIN